MAEIQPTFLQRLAARYLVPTMQAIQTVQKGFSLLPMKQDQVRANISPAPRPSDVAMLKQYGENPWLHLRLLRQCSALAGLGFKVMARDQRTGKLSPLAQNYPLWMLLRRPSPAMRGWDFRFLSELYVRVTGEVYWHIIRDGLGVSSLRVYPRMWVTPRYDNRSGQLAFYHVQAKLGPFFTQMIRVAPTDMIWLRTPDPSDPYVVGLGDVLSLATEVDTYELASESDRRFFKQDASPAGALVVPGSPTKDERDRIMDDWQQRVGGVEGTGNTPMLTGGMDYRKFREGRREMDFIEGQTMLRDFILAGVHKHIAGISDDVTFANAKAADYTFSYWDIKPRVMWWADNLNEQLAPLFDPRAWVEFDNPVPQDEAFELDKATKGLQIGALKRKDWLRVNGYPEVPEAEGNVYLLPLTMIEVPADQVGENPGLGRADQTDAEKPNPNAEKPKPANERVAEQVVPKALTPDQIDKIIGNLGKEAAALLKDLQGAYVQAYKDRFKDAAEEVGAPATGIGFDVVDARAFQYIREGAYPRIVGVTQTAFEEIHARLEEGFRGGEGATDLARRITDYFKGEDSAFRTMRIARQESMSASNKAALESYKVSGAVDKVEWLLAPDYDPADDDGECADLDGEVTNIGEPFPSAGVDAPPLHIMCRCAIAPVIPEERDVEDMEPDRVEATADMVDYADYNPGGGDVMALTEAGQTVVRAAIEDMKAALIKIWDEGEYAVTHRAAMLMESKMFPLMQKMLPKDELAPVLTNIARAEPNVRRSIYDTATGQIRLSREVFDDMPWGFRKLGLSEKESAWHWDTPWHEMAHALVDNGTIHTMGVYDTLDGTGGPLIEGLNQMLGSKFSVTFARALGQEITGIAETYFAGMAQEFSYTGAVNNMRNVFGLAGVNMNDERNLIRALNVATHAPGLTAARYESGPMAGRIMWEKMSENLNRIYDALFQEFKQDIEKAGIAPENFRTAMQAATQWRGQSRELLDALLHGRERPEL